MTAHEAKDCPRCGATFECRVGSITRCQCSDVAMDSETAERLALTYGDCLCRGCLLALAEAEPAPTPDPHQSPLVSESIRCSSRARR